MIAIFHQCQVQTNVLQANYVFCDCPDVLVSKKFALKCHKHLLMVYALQILLKVSMCLQNSDTLEPNFIQT